MVRGKIKIEVRVSVEKGQGNYAFNMFLISPQKSDMGRKSDSRQPRGPLLFHLVFTQTVLLKLSDFRAESVDLKLGFQLCSLCVCV